MRSDAAGGELRLKLRFRSSRPCTPKHTIRICIRSFDIIVAIEILLPARLAEIAGPSFGPVLEAVGGAEK
jgi:hypothetical protein